MGEPARVIGEGERCHLPSHVNTFPLAEFIEIAIGKIEQPLKPFNRVSVHPVIGKLHVRLNMADSEKGAEPLFKAPKTRSGRRTIDIDQKLVHELKVWKLKCPHNDRGLILVADEGKPLSRKSMSRMLDEAIVAAELKKRLTPHGLRHSFASLLLADGADVPEVSHLLGHKDSSITLRVYAHFVRRETRSVHKLAAGILG
jgi:integrase